MPQTPPQTDTYNTALDIFDRTHPLRVDADENLKVTGTFTPSGTQDVNIVGSVPIPVTQSGSWTVSLTSESIEIGTVDQGTAGSDPWLVDVSNTISATITNFPAIQPVSQSGTWTTGRTWTLLNTTDSVNVGNFPATQPVSGTVTTLQGTSPWIVSGTITTSPDVNLHDGTGNPITSTGGALDVAVSFPGSISVTQGTSPWVVSGSVAVTNFPATQPVSGTVTALQGTTPWTVNGTVAVTQSGTWTTGRTWALSSGTDSVNVGNFPATQPVSGTITANQGTSPWVVSGSVTTSPDVNIHDSAGNALASTGTSLNVNVTNTVPVTGPLTDTQLRATPVPISGTVTANAGTGNFTVVQPTGTNLHVVLDSGTLTSITNALPAGTNVIGHVIADSGSTTAVTGNVTVVQPTGTNLHAVVDSGSITINNAAGASAVNIQDGGNTITVDGTVTANAGTGTFQENVAQFGGTNVVTGTGTSGAGIPRVTVSNDSNVLATQSGTWTVQPGNTANTTPWLVETRASTLATYSASITSLAAAVTPTDIFTLTGSATKTVKILRLVFSATATAETTYNAILLKRSTANSAGTSTTPTVVPHDSNNAAGTAVVRAYTANPTLGTLVGNLSAMKGIAPATAPGQPANIIMIYDANDHGQPVVLRGTAEVFAFNLNSTTIVGNSFDIAITWTEE